MLKFRGAAAGLVSFLCGETTVGEWIVAHTKFWAKGPEERFGLGHRVTRHRAPVPLLLRCGVQGCER